jgi:hypothetical protein
VLRNRSDVVKTTPGSPKRREHEGATLARALLRQCPTRDDQATRLSRAVRSVEKYRLRGPSLAGRGGERVVNLWWSSLKRSRDFGPFFDRIRPFLPHPGRDGFGTETLGSRCEGCESCKERRDAKKAERVALGWLALTPWWTGLQAK